MVVQGNAYADREGVLMKVAFRVDASLQIGSGHVVRCLTLANALREKGCKCCFLCREHPGHLVGLIRSHGHEVYMLPEVGDAIEEHKTAHSAWLGTTQKLDAESSGEFLEKWRPVWLIVDHYALDCAWERQVRRFCQNLLVIDDLADRKHICDMLLDQNWHGADNGFRYKSLLDCGVRQLLGPQYALLTPEYREARLRLEARNGIVMEILVFMGGSDINNTTKLILESLFLIDLSDIKIKVVTGINYPHYEELIADFGGRKNLEILRSVPTLATMMRESDLVIGAGGSTNWERMCLGVPSIVLSVAQNQVEICKLLSRDGYINYLGRANEVDSGVICNAVSNLIKQTNLLREQSIRMMKIVDGLGVGRVCAKIIDRGKNGIIPFD